MILQALYNLYSRLVDDPAYEVAAPGFSRQKITFRVVLRLDGSLQAFEDARIPNDQGKLAPTSMQVPGDSKPSGAGVNPCFLWDNQTYMLGRQPEDKKGDFSGERFEAFRKLHLSVEGEINVPHFSAVCRFLERWTPDQLKNHAILDELVTGFGVFQIQGERECVHDRPSVVNWWKARQAAADPPPRAQCLVCGEVAPIARLHPKIKGVDGAQSTGASVVSFNAPAYESFGKTQSFNGPVAEEAANRYGAALNSLLTSPMARRHRLRIGDTTTVFWTDKPTAVENCFADLLGGGSNVLEETQDPQRRAQVERLLRAVREGNNFEDYGDELRTEFYILGLAPNAGRLSVRFFHRSSIAELLSRLHEHHRCMETVRQYDEPGGRRPPDPQFPAIWQLLRETARDPNEIPPLLAGAIARAIVEGVGYPEALYSAVIRRIRSDASINYFRAVILKATLVRNHKLQIPAMLDPDNPEPGYRLGRLFSALEKTQEDALGNLNAGIRDRFYAAASATPASVFPRLLRLYQHHLAKLGAGARIRREQLVQEILNPVREFPSHLDLRQQGCFALGYYHQRKSFFTRQESEGQSAPESSEQQELS